MAMRIGPDLYLHGLKCHPWWLVTGSIPVMTSYGHGHGFGQQIGMFEYFIMNIMFLKFVVCDVFWFFINQTICSSKTINRYETNFL